MILISIGCDDDDDSKVQDCNPGTTRDCVCSNDSENKGIETCNEDGNVWSSCEGCSSSTENANTNNNNITDNNENNNSNNEDNNNSEYIMEEEICDGVDNDCDDSIDEENVCSTVIPDTNQNTCYNDITGINCPLSNETYYGQDAQYKSSSISYTNNEDGTVTDNVTGLMWQKEFTLISWEDAEEDATITNTGGYNDWRVPTIKELYSLILFNGSTGTASPSSQSVPSNAIPYLDTDYFDFEYPSSGNMRYIDAQYISSTSSENNLMYGQESFFGVNFADGRIKGYPKENNPNRSGYYARYVRNNPDYGINDFNENGDGTITDYATSLTWMQLDSGNTEFSDHLNNYNNSDGSLNWEEALNFCENLVYAGKNNWRLPNAKELESIVDYTRSPNTTNSAAIDPVFDITSINNADGDINYPFFWTGTTHLDGMNLGEYAAYVAFGRAEGFLEIPRNSGELVLTDVHGAGAQRSDPKSGNPSNFPEGHGPQGDVIGIYNYARCVTGGNISKNENTDPQEENQDDNILNDGEQPNENDSNTQGGAPPQEAIDACNGLSGGDSCSIETPQGTILGTCMNIENELACVPENGPPSMN